MAQTPKTGDVVEVDILDLSDFRFEGGTSGSVAEEVRAQAAAGFSTALLHLGGPLHAHASPFNPAIRRCVEAGAATLALPGTPVRAKLAVARHPAVLQHSRSDLDHIDVEQLVVVANAPPRDIDGFVHYKPGEVRRMAIEKLGVEPLWAPIGPQVRHAIVDSLWGQRVLEADWVNIIDADHWKMPRDTWVADIPVIGRHSRDSTQKWPADAKTLTQAYPIDGSARVSILGGTAPVKRLLGRLPDSWETLPFGAADPREFLSKIDFFVYFHHPRWIEAFGRTILEAMASGAVPILPHHFSATFGDGALYAAPPDVQPLIQRLFSDRVAYERQSRRGQRTVRERFSHSLHIDRISRLLSSSSRPTSPAASSAPAASAPSQKTQSVLMISGHGAGMGNLTRLIAMARRLPSGMTPHFVSLSQTAPVARHFEYGYEYLPSAEVTGLSSSRWQEYFDARVSEVIERLRPRAVLFDGAVPFEGIGSIRHKFPDLRWIWSRQATWLRAADRQNIVQTQWFDSVIEPGELAAPDDHATVDATGTRVSPITLLDVHELDSRSRSRAALGLHPDAPAALINLGARGGGNELSRDVAAVADGLRDAGVQVCVAAVAPSEQLVDFDANVLVTDDYPLSRYHTAFDLAVSAAGYNSFHELLRFGTPTVFIPDVATAQDDQEARARYAADNGWAYQLDMSQVHNVPKVAEDLLRDGKEMAARARAADPGNGAQAAADEIARVIYAPEHVHAI